MLLSYGIKLGMEDRTGIYGFIIFVPAVIAASIIFDRGSGYLAVAVSIACVASGLTWSPHLIEPHISAFATFLVVGLLLVFVSEGLRRALEKADEATRQRDLLLQEMSHRVKNKFAMIQSVIGLQARAAPAEVRQSLEAVAGRVKVIASVHDHLQMARHDGIMDMQEYLNRLCHSLAEVLGHLRPIAMSLDIDRVDLPPDRALPTGLIVNELITNAYKYAFPDERPGRISVSLKSTGRLIELVVADDGVGGQVNSNQGLGTTLVNVLAGQLGGSVCREALQQGWRVRIAFEADVSLAPVRVRRPA